MTFQSFNGLTIYRVTLGACHIVADMEKLTGNSLLSVWSMNIEEDVDILSERC